MDTPHFVYPLTSWVVGTFLYQQNVMDNAAINGCIQVFVWTYLIIHLVFTSGKFCSVTCIQIENRPKLGMS